MKNPLNYTIAAATLAVGVLLPFTTAQATNGLLPFGNGIAGHGLGGAGIANPGDAMAAVDNPALLGQTGGQISLGASLFNPNRSADLGLGGGYVESDSKYFVIPQFSWTGIINDKVNWGVMVTALGGMNTDYPKELFGQAAEMDLSGLIVAPTVSLKTGANSYFGASILLGYEALNSTLPPSDDNTPGAPFATNEDTATGTGLKLGFTTKDSAGNQYGAFYQTRIDMSEMDKHCTGSGLLANFKAGGGDCSLNLAPMYGVGVSLQVSDKSKIVTDFVVVKWTDVAVFADAFQWKDQTILKIGYERIIGDGFTWRIGYNHARTPIQDNFIAFVPPGASAPVAPGVIAPAITEDHYTVGFSKKIGKNELVGYYAYIPENEQTGPNPGAFGGGPVKIKMNQHALGIGFNWK